MQAEWIDSEALISKKEKRKEKRETPLDNEILLETRIMNEREKSKISRELSVETM